MDDVGIAQFPTAFRWSFKHASAIRKSAENVLVCIGDPDDPQCGFGEACPRSYVTGETIESVTAFVRRHGRDLVAAAGTVGDLRSWIADKSAMIDGNPAAFGALEQAMLDRLGRRGGQNLETLLGIGSRARPATYSAVLGDSGMAVFTAQAVAYRAMGLRNVKFKLSAASARPKVRLLKGLFGSRLRLRGDGNNLWRDAGAAIEALDVVRNDLWAVEEPLRAGDFAGCRDLAEALDVRIILDESLTRREQLEDLADDPQRWLANIRVSKMGGVIRAIDLAERATVLGIGVVIGAHVGETSLLTRGALAVAASLPAPPTAMEGAFGTWLLREDVVAEPVMFGRGGVLVPSRAFAAGAGSGLTLKTAVRERFVAV